jgi:hypothetical protein
LTDPFDGFLLGKRYLLHDRDTKFTRAFDALLRGSLKTCQTSQATDHEMDHRHTDHGLTCLG